MIHFELPDLNTVDWAHLISPSTFFTAILSAFITSLLTHLYTRHRARYEWTRQRMFEMVVLLNDLGDQIEVETSKYPHHQDLGALAMDCEMIESLFSTVDFSSFNETVNKYHEILAQLQLLLRDGTHIARSVSRLDEYLSELSKQYRFPYVGYEIGRVITPNPVNELLEQANRKFYRRHRVIITHLKTTYFTGKKGRRQFAQR